MATIKDVALRAGVAASTVSRVLSGKAEVNDSTKERVLQAVEELNYQPNLFAKGLKEGKSNTVGLVVPNIRDLVFPAAIRGISDYLEKHGYTLILVNTDDKIELEKFHVENLQKRMVDGLIFSTAKNESKHLLELKEKGFPVVLLIRHLGNLIDAVIVDNYKGGYEATKYLLNQGFRKIAIINGNMELDLYQERFRGYEDALKDAGLVTDTRFIVNDVDSWEDSYQAVKEMLLTKDYPEAVFATSDPKALGVVRALKDLGLRVPEDVSVIGFDNIDVAEVMDPPLTTIAQPFYEIGCKAAERLVKLMKSKKKMKPVVEKLDVQLLVRKSVALRNNVRREVKDAL
ncbi:MAG: LacI family DNA-binding transcriptional regulator [Bacillota bacterium]